VNTFFIKSLYIDIVNKRGIHKDGIAISVDGWIIWGESDIVEGNSLLTHDLPILPCI